MPSLGRGVLSPEELAAIAAHKEAKRQKKEAKKLAITHGPAQDQCSFFLPAKKKYCNSKRALGQDFCQAHLAEKVVAAPTAGAAASVVVRQRVPCPFDDSHTVYADELRKHRFRCPFFVLQFLISSLPCFVPSCNTGACSNKAEMAEVAGFAAAASAPATAVSSSSDGAASSGSGAAEGLKSAAKSGSEHAAEAAVTSKLYTATASTDLLGVFRLIQGKFQEMNVQRFISNPEQEFEGDLAQEQEQEKEQEQDGEGHETGERRSRHDLQADAIVRHMKKAGMMEPDFLQIEFGAGNATLGEAVVRGFPPLSVVVSSVSSPADADADGTDASDASDASTRPLHRYEACKLVLVEKMGGTSRRDFDIQRLFLEARTDLDVNRPADKDEIAKLMRTCFARVRCDIGNFWLLGHPAFIDKEKAVIPAQWKAPFTKAKAAWKKEKEKENGTAAAEAGAGAGIGEASAADQAEGDSIQPPLSKRPRLGDDEEDADKKDEEEDNRDAAAGEEDGGAAASTGPGGDKKEVFFHDHKKEDAESASWRCCDTCTPARCVLPRSLGDLIKDAPLDNGALPPLPHHTQHLTPAASSGGVGVDFKGRKAVLCAKHLCGGATDLALRCIANALVGYRATRELAGDDDDDNDDHGSGRKEKAAVATEELGSSTSGSSGVSSEVSAIKTEAILQGTGLAGFGGVAIATCCHHRCDWSNYVGKRWWRTSQATSEVLRELGVSMEASSSAAPTTAAAFELTRLLSSWGPSYDTLAETGVKGGKRAKTLEVSAASSLAAAASAPAPGVQADASLPSSVAAADPSNADAEDDANSPRLRRQVGRMSKRLIDAGRCAFLAAVLEKAAQLSRAASSSSSSSSGSSDSFAVSLRYFCPTSWSPENCLLLGEVKRSEE